jgi:hypothetical protein
MRALMSCLLSLLLVAIPAAPLWASPEMAAAHMLGCDMTPAAMAGSAHHAAHGQASPDQGDEEPASRSCPLAAACFTSLAAPTAPSVVKGSLTPVRLLAPSARLLGPAGFDLDPPPPRLGDV